MGRVIIEHLKYLQFRAKTMNNRRRAGGTNKKQKQNWGLCLQELSPTYGQGDKATSRMQFEKSVTSSYRIPKPAAFTADGPFMHISLHLGFSALRQNMTYLKPETLFSQGIPFSM